MSETSKRGTLQRHCQRGPLQRYARQLEQSGWWKAAGGHLMLARCACALHQCVCCIVAAAASALEEIAKDKDILNCPPERLIIDENGKVVELSGQPVLEGAYLDAVISLRPSSGRRIPGSRDM